MISPSGHLAARLQRAVAREVRASPEVIEDACQTAWLIFMRHQPERGPTLLGWLRTVAVRQAWDLAAREHRALPLETLSAPADGEHPTGDDWGRCLAGQDGIDEALEAREALRTLARLPERQRRYVAMHVAGLSYREIQAADGGVSYTAVNRHPARARRRLREERRDTA
ncbi:MAG: RNA polymerase sigma factor [Solirubrobacteraceae bacterium]